jgi:hypothetical protein
MCYLKIPLQVRMWTRLKLQWIFFISLVALGFSAQKNVANWRTRRELFNFFEQNCRFLLPWVCSSDVHLWWIFLCNVATSRIPYSLQIFFYLGRFFNVFLWCFFLASVFWVVNLYSTPLCTIIFWRTKVMLIYPLGIRRVSASIVGWCQ